MTTAVAAGPAGSVEAFERLMLEDIRAGRGFHQTPTAPAGPLRARSVDVVDSAHGGNVYEAYNAHLLHVQMRVRGVTNPEFVSRGQIDKLGGRRVGGEAGYWVAAGEKRAAHVGSTIKVSGDPYVVYHLDSQTSLASREQPCAAVKQGSERGLDAHVARVQKVAALSGVRVDFGKDDRCRVVSDGKSPRVLVPDFRSVSRAGLPGWSSAVLTAVASAVQGDRILRGQIEADAVEVGAVRSENRVRLRNNARCRDRSEKLPRLALQGGDAAAGRMCGARRRTTSTCLRRRRSRGGRGCGFTGSRSWAARSTTRRLGYCSRWAGRATGSRASAGRRPSRAG